MKNLLLVVVISSISHLATAAPSNSPQCRQYYSLLKEHIQRHLGSPRPGNCIVEVTTNNKRFTNVDIKEGTRNTCTDVINVFDTILYKNIPYQPSEACFRTLTINFQIPDTKAAEEEKRKVADNLKNRLHQQLKELKTD